MPGGALKTARKGCGEFELTIAGVAAHAGVDPGKGASAIHELADQIAAVERLQDLTRGISVNVGVVSGGTRPNVVAAEARALIDVRAPTNVDADHVEAALRALQPRRPRRASEYQRRFRAASAGAHAGCRSALLAGVATWPPPSDASCSKGSTGGGSDGNFTAAIGVPTLDGLGPIGDGAHAAHEHVEIAALPWRAALVAGLLGRLAVSRGQLPVTVPVRAGAALETANWELATGNWLTGTDRIRLWQTA